jgi:hypothetical protein
MGVGTSTDRITQKEGCSLLFLVKGYRLSAHCWLLRLMFLPLYLLLLKGSASGACIAICTPYF